jgi:hypothetical protein
VVDYRYQYMNHNRCCDILGDCRKSPKMTILVISYVMKSTCYEHQNHKIRVFRQSLEISHNFEASKSLQ